MTGSANPERVAQWVEWAAQPVDEQLLADTVATGLRREAMAVDVVYDIKELERADAARFRDACLQAGFGAQVVTDIRAALWHKFVGLTVNSALTSLVRQPAGVIYPDPDLMAIARAGFAETAAVGRAMDVKLPEDIVDWQARNHLGFPAGMYASMYHDLVRGKRLELESLSGLVAREGKRLGVPTPFHSMAYACLKPYAPGTKT